jgi:hypothetical protein
MAHNKKHSLGSTGDHDITSLDSLNALISGGQILDATGDIMTGSLVISGGSLTVDGQVKNSATPFNTTPISGGYSITTEDAGQILYVSNGPITLNQSPISGEHIWINNEGTINVVISGGTNTINGLSTQILPKDSTYHLHYNDKEWRAI